MSRHAVSATVAVAALSLAMFSQPVQAQDTPSAQELAALRARAEVGDADAQTSLGWRSANGEGVQQDDAEAIAWFRLAETCRRTFLIAYWTPRENRPHGRSLLGGRDRRTRGRRTVFVKAGTGGQHDINTASIEHHSGINSRCRVNGSRTLEPRQHHSTQENCPSNASRVSIRSSGAPRLGSRASTRLG